MPSHNEELFIGSRASRADEDEYFSSLSGEKVQRSANTWASVVIVASLTATAIGVVVLRRRRRA